VRKVFAQDVDFNYRRNHGSLGKTPMIRCAELNATTTEWGNVIEQFDPQKETHGVEQLTLSRCSAKPSKERKDASGSR